MYLILIMTFVALLISLVMGALALVLGRKSMKDREKLTPFECGFDPFKKARVPFSLRFFLVTVIFLVFDAEIALLLPLGILSTGSDPVSLNLVALLLTLILILGLLHEWNQGGLDWIK